MNDIGQLLYRQYLDGDKSAFEKLISLYNENLIFFITRYVHSLDVAEDIAEDCFVELIVHPHRYNFKVSLKTYLFTVARNKAVDNIRHNSVINLMPLDEQCAKSAEYISFENDMLRNEERKAVNAAVSRLKKDYGTALHLVYFEELSYEETGRIMHKTRKQVENLVYRAKNELRKILTEEGWNDEKQG